MDRARGLLTLLIVPLVAGLATSRPAFAQQDSTPKVSLRFAWPTGSHLDVAHRRYRYQLNGGSLDSSDVTWHFRLGVGRDGGRTLIDLLSLHRSETGDSAAAPAPPLKGIQPMATLVIDDTGAPSGVRRVERLIERLRPEFQKKLEAAKLLGAEASRSMERRFGKEVTEAMIAGEWVQLVGFWMGADLPLGEEFTLDEQRENPLFPGTFVPVNTRFAALDRYACGPGRADTSCVHLVSVATMDADSMAAAMRRFVGSGAQAADIQGFENITFERRVDLYVEPWTMLPTRMTVSSQLRFELRSTADSVQRFDQSAYDEYDFTVSREPTPLQAAAAAGDEKGVEAALRARAEPDLADADGLTPLYLAARQGHAAVARRLIRGQADPQRAFRLARERGDLVAMRLLRTLAQLPPSVPGALDVGQRLFEAKDVRAAVALFADAALGESPPGAAHAALADALGRAAPHTDLARVPAEAALATDPCDRRALRALRELHDRSSSSWPGADDARAAEYAARLVRCAPASGDAWVSEAWFADLRGDSAATIAAIARADSLGFLTPGVRALSEWTLQQLPPNALYLTVGSLDYLPLLHAQARGVRPDVAVVQAWLVDRPAYLRVQRDRHRLPVPFDDAAIDSIAREPWALWGAVAAHWRTEAWRRRLGRPLTMHLSVRVNSIRGDGAFWPRGAYVELGDTTLTASSAPSLIWGRLRPALGVLEGPITAADDPSPSRRDYDLRLDLIGPLSAYLHTYEIDGRGLGAPELEAFDSLVTLTERLNEDVEWTGRDDLRARTAFHQASLARARYAGGDRARARRHLDAAVRLAPKDPGGWTSLAWAAMLEGRHAAAEPMLQRAFEMNGGFPSVLAAITLARLRDRADSSLALLARAQRMIDNTPPASRGDIGQWSFFHLPRTSADTTGPVRQITVSSFSELEAIVGYQLAIAEAMREGFEAADKAMERALWLSASDPMRCYVRNLLASTRGAARLRPRTAEWFTRQEERLSCPA